LAQVVRVGGGRDGHPVVGGEFGDLLAQDGIGGDLQRHRQACGRRAGKSCDHEATFNLRRRR
jgi:hypothetical protein